MLILAPVKSDGPSVESTTLFHGGILMLVLNRKIGERIRIDDVIELTVLEIRNDRVRLGFCGPREIPIHREEVHRRIVAERAFDEPEKPTKFRRRATESKLTDQNLFGDFHNTELLPQPSVTDGNRSSLHATS